MERIQEYNGQIKKEIFSPQIFINWDPYTNGGFIEWSPIQYVHIDGELTTKIKQTSFTTPIMEAAVQIFTVVDPIQRTEVTLSGAAVMEVFKKIFDGGWIKQNTPPEVPEVEVPEAPEVEPTP